MKAEFTPRPVEISVVCPVGRDGRDLEQVHREFREALASTNRTAEFIYVLDGHWPEHEAALRKIREDRFPTRVLRMAKGFGEATALQVGFERAAGSYVLTVSAWLQIDAKVVLRVLEALDGGAEAVVTRREPRSDALFNRIQSRVFHGLIRRLVGQNFEDMTCGVRGFTREAALKLDLYGDQHRFIPVIAVRHGYHVTEIPGAQHSANKQIRLYAPGVYLRRLLDILNIYFLTQFTRKPLRFFGLVGSTIGAIGLLLTAWLAVERLAFDLPLADRPLLLLGILLIVLGVQVISIGLLGEIIIFLSARRETPEIGALIDLTSERPDRQHAHQD